MEVFAADGSALTGPMRVGHSGGNDRDISPEIVALDDGGFMVFYDRNRGDEGLYAQPFATDASAAGEAFQVFTGRVGDSSAIELEDSRVAVSFETHSAGIRTEIIEGETLRSFVNAASADPANDVEGDVLRNIENVVGSAFDGRLFGSDGINVTDGGEGDDKLDGKDGADTIIGGAGNDLISATNAKGRTFDGGEGTDTLRLVGNDNLRDDTLLSIERLEIQSSASRVSKVILGESQLADLELVTFHSVAGRDANIEVVGENARVDISGLAFHGVGRGDEFALRGTAAADAITGSAIRDVIKGGGGRDTLDGGAGRDRPEVGDGDVLFIGGAGNDSILGGAGRDEVSYAGPAAAVQVSLLDENIRQTGGDAQGDKLISVENVTGSVLADTLIGNQAANALRGCGGNDLLSGEGGADKLRGEVGNDILIARNAVGGVFDGGEGSDILGVVGSGAFRGNSLEDIEALEIVAVAGQRTRVSLNLSEAQALGCMTALPANDAQ